MGTVLLLALTASLNPTLLGATTVMLLLDRPAPLMAGYLVGAALTSLTLGLIIVFSLSDSSAATTTETTLSPAADLALGTLLLLGAFALRGNHDERVRERRRARRAARGPSQPPRWQRELSKGSARITFVVGAMLTLPGASYLAGLKEIHTQQLSTPETVLAVVGFNLIMLWLLEVPLLSYLCAPQWTPGAISRGRTWVSGHARLFAVRGLAAIGALLVLKGLVGLLG